MWKIWAKALGQKSGKSDKEADTVALIRTFLVFWQLLASGIIVAGVIRHW